MFCSTLSSNKLENILKRRESKQSAIIKSRAEQGMTLLLITNTAKSKDWMMYDNYYEHPCKLLVIAYSSLEKNQDNKGGLFKISILLYWR